MPTLRTGKYYQFRVAHERLPSPGGIDDRRVGRCVLHQARIDLDLETAERVRDGAALLGLSLQSGSRFRHLYSALMGSIVVAMGTAALVGYAAGMPGAYRWGHFNSMALHTALGFILLGGGVVGAQAARIALGMGADVTLMDKSLNRLRELDNLFGGRVCCEYATGAGIEARAIEADLVVGAVLSAGAAAPRLLSEEQVSRMQSGAVLVAVDRYVTTEIHHREADTCVLRSDLRGGVALHCRRERKRLVPCSGDSRLRGLFAYALSVWCDVVVMSLAAGRGVEQAMETGAAAGQGWAFAELRGAFGAAYMRGEPPWIALAELGRELKVKDLEELASTISMAGEEGAAVRETLATKSRTIRERRTAAAEHNSASATEKMSLPAVLVVFGFMLFLGFPTVVTLFQGGF
jgi:hypothetical protein